MLSLGFPQLQSPGIKHLTKVSFEHHSLFAFV